MESHSRLADLRLTLRITSAKTACVLLAVFGWMSVVGTVWAQDADRAVQSYESSSGGIVAAEGIATGEADVIANNPVADSIYSPTDPRDAFDAGYDNGMFLRVKKNNDSFELKTNFRTQFRFVSFSRHEDTWTDNAGVVRPIDDRQNLETFASPSDLLRACVYAKMQVFYADGWKHR